MSGFGCAALLACAPVAALAQSVQGTLTEQESGRAISGAIVVLLSEQGAQIGGALTDADGLFRIQGPAPGRYRLRAERIGYKSVTSPVLELSAGQTLDYQLEVPTEAIRLDGVISRGERRCTLRPAEGLKTAAVWEEARKALAATALVQEQQLLRYEITLYQRQLDPSDLRVLREQRRSRIRHGTRPFVSLAAEQLRDSGFVRPEGEDRIYYAPDARVLLSDEFLDTHCLRVIPSRSESQGSERIGLRFEPVPGRRVPEIAGTLWLDLTTSELRLLEYAYTNLDLDVQRGSAGGRVEFEALPSGHWIVRRWWIRMPEVGVRRMQGPSGWSRDQQEILAIREEGGEVVRLFEQNSMVVGAIHRAQLSGTVHDSTRAEALVGAMVHIEGTDHSARTDSTGRFRIEGLPGGNYSVGFSHPRLDSLGIFALPPHEVAVEVGRDASVHLSIPSLARIWAAACLGEDALPSERPVPPSDEVAALVGMVRDAGSGLPIPGATVTAQWIQSEHEVSPQIRRVAVAERTFALETTTDSEGRYRLCEVPARTRVSVQARFIERDGPKAEVDLTPSVPLLVDLEIKISQPTRVSGRVVDFSSRRPVKDVRVRLGESGPQRLTDREGRFSFREVAPGAQTFTFEHVGYGRQEEQVEIPAGGSPVTLEVRLPPEAIALEGVTVSVLSTGELEVRAATSRRDLFVRKDLETISLGARHLGDVLQGRVPGLRISEMWAQIPGCAFEPCVERIVCVQTSRRALTPRAGGGRCAMMMVVVDNVRVPDPGGFLLTLSPADVESVEVLSPLQAGARYGTGAADGVLLIYTRGNGPYAERRN